VKKPQWITAGIAILTVIVLYIFGRTTPNKSEVLSNADTPAAAINSDSILNEARQHLSPEQLIYITELENSVVRGTVKDQQLEAYHQLAHFWRDTARVFEPYAWYEAESARLENSEKNLTFAAQLFLDNLETEENPRLKTWKGLQAKDLFERSLKLNPDNDSASVGLGATYLFGNFAEQPMEGIQLIRNVLDKDSTNTYALMTLGEGAFMTGQYDRAAERFEKVNELDPSNLKAILLMAEVCERQQKPADAVKWYRKSIDLINNPEIVNEVNKRIASLSGNE